MKLELQDENEIEVTIYKASNMSEHTYVGKTVQSLLLGKKNPYPTKVKNVETWVNETNTIHDFNISEEGNGNIHCAIVMGILIYQDDRTGYEDNLIDEDSIADMVSTYFNESN